MRLLIVTVTVVVALTIAHAQPQEPLAAASFEGDLEGWSLQLNRGGEVELSFPEDAAVGARSLRFEPQALCAPGDIVSPTNIHIWREPFSFEPGRRYELSAWAKSEEGRRPFRLGGRRTNEGLGLSTHEAGPQWRRYTHLFTPNEAMDDVRLQIVVGGDERPIMVDGFELRELPADALLRADYFAWRDAWSDPARWSDGAEVVDPGRVRITREAAYLQPLPVDYDLQIALVADDEATVALTAGGRLISSIQLPGEGEERLVVIEQRGSAPADGLTLTVEDGGVVEVRMMDGYEMLPARQDGDMERSEHADPETGARITRLTHSPYEDKHAYYDVDPWSPDGTTILFCSTLPGQTATGVWLMDTDGSNMRKIGDTSYFGYHTGCFPVWAADGESVYWRDFGEVDGVRKVVTVRHFLADGRNEVIPVGVRQISPSGQVLEVRAQEDAPVRGLFTSNADGSDHRLLASVEEMIALSPFRERIEAENLRISLPNCKWNSDGTRAFVVFAGRNEQNRAEFVEVYSINADGSGLTRSAQILHHPIWHPDGEQILFNATDGLYLVKYDGSNLRKISDCGIGHPSFNREGTMIVTDGYGPVWGDAIWLVDPETGEARKLCNVPNTHGRTHERGTQPHPVFSHDGTRVLYDSDESGRSQLYEVEVGE